MNIEDILSWILDPDHDITEQGTDSYTWAQEIVTITIVHPYHIYIDRGLSNLHTYHIFIDMNKAYPKGNGSWVEFDELQTTLGTVASWINNNLKGE